MPFFRALLVLAFVRLASFPAELRLLPHALSGTQRCTGAALTDLNLLVWGDRLTWRVLPRGEARVVPTHAAVRSAAFLNGGVVLNDITGELVWLEPPAWKRHSIDTGIDTADILSATIHGRRGVLIVQKRMQVRFYEAPDTPGARWLYRDLYSVYTPSWQGGLRLADIDGDGRPDILCGNYWIRCPRRFDLPWRLFAIDAWSEQPPSAMLWLDYGRILVAAQREMPQARLAWFEKPADPRRLWIEHRLEDALARPSGVALADFDGDGRPDILVSEAAGAGRLLLYLNRGHGTFTRQVLRHGAPCVRSFAADINGDGRPDIVAIGLDSLSWWENRTNK